MTDLTKLVSEWREDEHREWCCSECRDMAADRLEAVLPEWTKITGDNWPDNGNYFWAFKGKDGKWNNTNWEIEQMKILFGVVNEVHYREFCSLDFPPDQQPDMENDDG